MLNEIMKIVNEAVKAETPVFMKLVQFDALKEIQKLAGQNEAADKASPEAELTKQLDEIMNQIGKDLDKQIIAKFASLK